MEDKRIEIFDEATGDVVSDEFRNYLISNGFFILPASVHHHGNYPGGLFDHCCTVMNFLADVTMKMDIRWERNISPIIVGMFHDLCKVESYKRDLAANEFYYNDRQILPGHGDKSILLLSQFMTLTEEEVYCIRFHMGPYEQWSREQYGRAVEKYKTVLWTHTADMYASKVLGI